MAFILQIVGYKNSGKTTLTSSLVQVLKQRSCRVAVIKHSHHDFVIDQPKTDSATFTLQGAEAVLLTSPYKFALMEKRSLSLAEALAKLPASDVVLVEGFKQADFPKIVLVKTMEEYVEWSKSLTGNLSFASRYITNSADITPLTSKESYDAFAEKISAQIWM